VRKIEDAPDSGAGSTEASGVAETIAALQNAPPPDQRSAAIHNEILEALRKRQELLRSGATSQQLRLNLDLLKAAFQKYEDWGKTDLQKQAAQHGLKFEQKGSQ
jgi:hypothetical protein